NAKRPAVSGRAVDVSVVVPAYRAETTLTRCVEGLLDQQFPGSFEVIVVASADATLDLPTLADDPRLRVMRHVPRLSAAAARNRGVAAAEGRLLVFTDADVVAPPEWLSALVSAGNRCGCTAGSVINGTPESAVGTVQYLVEFLDLAPT